MLTISAESQHHETKRPAKYIMGFSGNARNFRLWGTSPGGLGTNSPKSEAVCRHCLQTLAAEAIKI